MLRFWESTGCSVCKRSCERGCDNCGRAICSDHTLSITKAPMERMDFCPECRRLLKPDAVLGGVRLTMKMLREKWDDIKLDRDLKDP